VERCLDHPEGNGIHPDAEGDQLLCDPARDIVDKGLRRAIQPRPAAGPVARGNRGGVDDEAAPRRLQMMPGSRPTSGPGQRHRRSDRPWTAPLRAGQFCSRWPPADPLVRRQR
jgi:hypothetical protein